MLFPYLRFLLPVLWIVVATVVALLLYRTSSAMVEQVVVRKASQKKIRLVGSVAIALVVFVLLWRSTPSTEMRPDDRLLGAPDVRRLNEAKQEYDLAWNRLEACSQLTVIAQCAAEMAEARAARHQFGRLYAEMLQAGKGPVP